jgi:hypothetical protein
LVQTLLQQWVPAAQTIPHPLQLLSSFVRFLQALAQQVVGVPLTPVDHALIDWIIESGRLPPQHAGAAWPAVARSVIALQLRFWAKVTSQPLVIAEPAQVLPTVLIFPIRTPSQSTSHAPWQQQVEL